MNSNKSHLAHERRRPGGVTKTILSAVAVSAILNAAPAMAQTPAPPQHAAPGDVATPVQPLSVLPATGSPHAIAEPAMEEAKHVPRTNSLLSATLPQVLSP